MAYFKLSLLTKMYDPDNSNKYIKNLISEFYGNNIDEDLKRYEREHNLTPDLRDGLDNIYTKTYTYNEKLTLHQQGQSELSFSLDKMILDDDVWKDNPFASKIKSGSQLLLEDKYNNLYLFTVKDISYNITENNIIYNFSCQDSFSYQLSKQNDGYTIKNDINSKDFIGALSVDYWAAKIVDECKISYKYLRLDVPLYLCTDGTAINTVLNQNSSKKVLKILKNNYLHTQENSDLYELIPFTCSSTTANGALISLGEQVGLALKTATVFTTPENSNFVSLMTYFWYEPSKQDLVSGLEYSPFRNIKTFNLAQKADSLITTLNINSRTLSNDEIITALPSVSPFFINLFNSLYWKKYSQQYPNMYTNTLYGPQFSITYDRDGMAIVTHTAGSNQIAFRKELDAGYASLYSLYSTQIYQTQRTRSSITYRDNYGDQKVVTADNSIFTTYLVNETVSGVIHYYIDVIVENADFVNLQASTNFLDDYEIHVFFKTSYSDEDETFAKIADQLPWLENKLIDFSYFINSGLLSKLQEKDIRIRLYNDLRKINSDILLNSTAYYSRMHAQTKYLSEMTNNIDMVGAELSNLTSIYENKGSTDNYDTTNLIQRWNLLQANVAGASTNTDIGGSYLATSFIELYSTTSDYMRKFLNARQRCLKNLYNFRQYFNSPVDALYKQCYKIKVDIVDTEDGSAENVYRFEPTKNDTYQVLDADFVATYPRFFIFDENNNVVDYNNIKLYNNDSQHSVFDKENYLITASNYQDIPLHCYQDVLHQSGENDVYDEDKTYLRQVFFLRVSDMVNLLYKDEQGTIITAAQKAEIRKKVTPNSFFLHITICPEGSARTSDSALFPCHIQLYNKDSNYLIGWKLYEDGEPFNGSTMCMEADSYIIVDNVKYYYNVSDFWTLLDKPLYVGQYVNPSTSATDTIKFVDDTGHCTGPIFYQEITSTEILNSYLYRAASQQGLTPYIKNTFRYQLLQALLSGNTADSQEYKSYYSPANYTYSGTNYLGWGTYTDSTVKAWHIACGIAGILVPGMWLGALCTSFFLNDRILVEGGYSTTTTCWTETTSNFAPFISAIGKKNSIYIKQYPLDTIYTADSYTPIKLVTKTNYQNFYTRVNGNAGVKSFALAKDGTYCALDGYLVAKDTDELYPDFVSSLPRKYFYTTKPLTTLTSISYNTDGVALTFGNLINNASVFNSYWYRQTKTYKPVAWTAIASLPDSCTFLELEHGTGKYTVPSGELDQYKHYDIISAGKIKSKAEILTEYTSTPPVQHFYLIIDGAVSQIPYTLAQVESYINAINTNSISDENGILYNISDLYNARGIVENLYYVEERTKLSLASLPYENNLPYDITNHLLDNQYEFYNDNEERVYTINQIFGSLTYKRPQSYTYYLFDKTIPQTIRLYRYNHQSIVPDIISYAIDASTDGSHIGESPYGDFTYYITTTSINYNVTTNGDFWNKYTNVNTDANSLPMREYAALIESNLQLYWNEAYAASLLCDIFVPEEWRLKQDNVINHFNVVIVDSSNNVQLNTVYIPEIIKSKEAQYTITWNSRRPDVENGQLYLYNQLSDACRAEVDKMLERTQNVSTDYLYFTKIADNISFYTIKNGGCNWATFINQTTGLSLPDYTGWNGVAITYLTSHFVDAGTSNYELLLQRRDDLWRAFYEEYPYLFLESSYTNDSATTSEELLMMAKYAFEDQKYPEKSYSISLIDLVQDVESIDNLNGTYNPKYYRGVELKIGQSIKISAEDYTRDKDDIYEALSQLLFITDISYDLRNDGDCQLTVNTIKYQDKLIRRLAKLIRNNPLH